MTKEDKGNLALAATLTAVAGFIDAVGYLRLGRLFPSFMSGDSTQFGVAFAHHTWPKLGLIAALVALYLLGSAVGRVISIAAGTWRRPVILLLEAILVAGAALPAPRSILLLPLALATGLQNAAVHHAGETKTSSTYATGTLVNIAERFVDGLAGNGERWAFAPYVLLWVSLIAGATLGAFGDGVLALKALLVPAALLFVLAIVLLARRQPA